MVNLQIFLFSTGKYIQWAHPVKENQPIDKRNRQKIMNTWHFLSNFPLISTTCTVFWTLIIIDIIWNFESKIYQIQIFPNLLKIKILITKITKFPWKVIFQKQILPNISWMTQILGFSNFLQYLVIPKLHPCQPPTQ